MKNIKKIFLIISLLISISTSYAADVEEIEVVDNKKINISIDNSTIISEGEVTWELRVLNDLEVAFVSKDFQDSNKLLLTLSKELEEDTSYNLLSVFWVEWSIDFDLTLLSEGLEINNTEVLELEDQGITRIVIADSKNLEIYFNNPVEASEFEFKILKEVKIDKLSGLENKLFVSLSGSLNTNSDYLLMAISIVDSEWQEVFFEDGIYDFNTSEELEIIEEVKEEFNSAPDEKDIEEVAEWLETTPQAWAETWILLLLTLIVNTWIYLRKRILA